jgi:hypothetical protein
MTIAKRTNAEQAPTSTSAGTDASARLEGLALDRALMRAPLPFTFVPEGFVAEFRGLAIVLG